MSVLVDTGLQTGLVKFVQAATTTAGLPPLVKVKPKQLACCPKVVSGFTCGFQRMVVRPANEFVQPVVFGKWSHPE